MTLASNVLSVVPGLQATALVAHNLKAVPKADIKPQKNISIKPVKTIVRTGVGNLVGISLIRPTASAINSL